ncbi:T6SS immunity protein Tli4 family protein [Iodobacter arcticus]|uniref:T6SS immunity protein Tli4 family protein n=1 Tax=Iodobacter arcticus TaxID=590593 RepID=A0ABW2QZJ3_9NEIS
MININCSTNNYLGLLIVGIVASTPSFADKDSTMNQTRPKIDALFKQTKSVCFGRFILQVPVSALVTWGETHVRYDIESYPNGGVKIPVKIREKTEEIKAIKHIREPSTFIGVFDGPNKESKIVVGYPDFTDNLGVQIHSFIRLGETGFIQKADITLKSARDENGDDKYDKQSYKQFVVEFQEIAGLLRLRSDAEIPTVPGICIEAGFMPEAVGKYHEMTSIGFSFPEYPDVRFSVSTIRKNKVNPESSLENIMKNAREEAGLFGLTSLFNRIKVLRKGERKIGDWDGAEQLSWMPPDEKGMPWTHEFKFKSIGVAKDMFRPYINMELSTGVSKNSKGVNEPSLKDDEAIALWDKLTTSIQTRPTK